jgi:hypothetical protein
LLLELDEVQRVEDLTLRVEVAVVMKGGFRVTIHEGDVYVTAGEDRMAKEWALEYAHIVAKVLGDQVAVIDNTGPDKEAW